MIPGWVVIPALSIADSIKYTYPTYFYLTLNKGQPEDYDFSETITFIWSKLVGRIKELKCDRKAFRQSKGPGVL